MNKVFRTQSFFKSSQYPMAVLMILTLIIVLYVKAGPFKALVCLGLLAHRGHRRTGAAVFSEGKKSIFRRSSIWGLSAGKEQLPVSPRRI